MLTLIFIVSLAILGAMLGLKWIEEKKEKKLFLGQLRKRADAMAMKIISRLKIFSVFWTQKMENCL